MMSERPTIEVKSQAEIFRGQLGPAGFQQLGGDREGELLILNLNLKLLLSGNKN